jgi:hypothetical protein
MVADCLKLVLELVAGYGGLVGCLEPFWLIAGARRVFSELVKVVPLVAAWILVVDGSVVELIYSRPGRSETDL